jgi:hypothetical protein
MHLPTCGVEINDLLGLTCDTMIYESFSASYSLVTVISFTLHTKILIQYSCTGILFAEIPNYK